MSQLDPARFRYLQKFLDTHTAIQLEAGKEYLATSRLYTVARDLEIPTIDGLLLELERRPWGDLHVKVVDAMTTNETSFFRDIHPFEALKTDLFPSLFERRKSERTLNILCAACSTGQEPYTIAMTLREHFPSYVSGWRIKIHAFDLCTTALAQAKAGRYTQLEVNRGMPAMLLVKYFKRDGASWQLKDEVRNMISFSQVNLCKPWPALPAMDIVFIRNVLIYFNVETKKTILAKIRRTLRPDGHLFLGAAETTLNLDDAFVRVPLKKGSCYCLRTAGGTKTCSPTMKLAG